ncbi:MAG TPA: carbohydrate ABC transporter permease [Bacilli bacterium]|jgi:ABC-type glycerol-3-phosphate transport system permease component|nr:MAG: L-arabinose transport system permease protein AraQ [Tenericutes bacterium ADurb.Bin140]HOE78081.1 carbohydrate ABC transporter permease [Bacilli bacterium]HOR95887.1 carbohydrate ABC transporter permease [Bacilli bacterium]HPD13210.1 carbohydrate ABC transporter permease [Bacilli bacterium]HPK58777.1 carbohydrate ABC transporter permease [Bacilli bacterium]
MELEKVFDVTVEEDHSYAPVITTLTDRQKRIIKIRKRIKYCLKIINYLLLIGVGLTFVYPFVWMFVMSVRSYDESILFSGGLWVNEWHWENYVEAWNRAQFSKYLGNSITYAALVLGLQYFFIVPAAYAFARMEFKGKGFLFQLKQLGMMLPGEATLIPVYFFYSKLGLVDTWTGLVLPSLFSMFGIYMFTNNFKTIPQDIIESALIDKAKNRQIMLRIMVPMIFPVFVTHFLLTFISNWNSYYWVLVMTNSEKLKTLPVAVKGLLKADGILPPWHLVMAGNIMQLAPILIMYILGNQQMKRAMIGGRKIKFAGGDKESLIKRGVKALVRKLNRTSKEVIFKER